MDKSVFLEALDSLNIELTETQINQFEAFSRLLVDWNTRINLTAITDPSGISIKHFIDSLLPLSVCAIPHGGTVCDVGTGAGFPGIPIKIAREDIQLTLLDSLNKRVNFLKEVVSQLNLSAVSSIHTRAEDLAKQELHREKYDFVFSRAVADMGRLSEYCLPFVKNGGFFVALKSNDIDEELTDAKEHISLLGGEISDIKKIPLPLSDIVRSIVIVQKVSPSPLRLSKKRKK